MRQYIGEDLTALTIHDLDQLEEQLEYSVNKVRARKACKFLDKQWSPKFTVIVAQKNHHTKFFQPSSPDNVPPGTVIDNKVCHPRNYDFYMCSHAGMISLLFATLTLQHVGNKTSSSHEGDSSLSGARRLRDDIVLGYQLQRVPGRDISILEWYTLAENEVGLRPNVTE